METFNQIKQMNRAMNRRLAEHIYAEHAEVDAERAEVDAERAEVDAERAEVHENDFNEPTNSMQCTLDSSWRALPPSAGQAI